MEKKRMIATSKTVVSALLEALGNLMRRKRSVPNSATTSRLNQTSSAEFIRLDDATSELKKS
jgi:hypothetical protein